MVLLPQPVLTLPKRPAVCCYTFWKVWTMTMCSRSLPVSLSALLSHRFELWVGIISIQRFLYPYKELSVRDHPTVLHCHHCSSAVPSCAQAIRELPLLPLTSLTRFADNTHLRCLCLFFHSLSLSLCIYVFWRDLTPVKQCLVWTVRESWPLHSQISYPSGHSHKLP